MKQLDKEIDRKVENEKVTEGHEDLVYGSLVKILFGVQRLYTELSKKSCNPSCLSDAVRKFKVEIVEYQGVIADNQLKLSPKLIEDVYRFYSKVSELEIQIDEIKDQSNEVIVACVATMAEALADILIDYQKTVMERRRIIFSLEKSEFSSFRGCCGGPVDREVYAEYLATKAQAKNADGELNA